MGISLSQMVGQISGKNLKSTLKKTKLNHINNFIKKEKPLQKKVKITFGSLAASLPEAWRYSAIENLLNFSNCLFYNKNSFIFA